MRILPLPEFTSDALARRQAAQIAMYEGKADERIVEREDGTKVLGAKVPIVTDEYEDRLNPQLLSSWWDYNRRRYNAQEISLHQLRHTFLSLAAEQGVHPSVMQKLAGHSNPNITMKIYTHVNVEAKKAAMDAMQSAYMTRAKRQPEPQKEAVGS